MPRFFIGAVHGSCASVSGEDARHMALSLRMKVGDAVTVCDGSGTDFHCTISSIGPEEVLLQVHESVLSSCEPNVKITLFQAIPKGDKLDFIVQKATELGVSAIVPVLTERCISRPKEAAMDKKILRLSKIAEEAAKQSGRGVIPQVLPMMTFPSAVKKLSAMKVPLFFYENASLPLRTALERSSGDEIGLFVGSEGGFSPKEADLAASLGLEGVSLGARILRCETAPIAALSAILYAFDQM